MRAPAALLLDGYKTGHPFQFPVGTTLVHSNYTCRGSRIPGVDKTIFFGLQYIVKEYLIDHWANTFFSRPQEEAVGEYKYFLEKYCPLKSYDHMYALHDVGYLPVLIKAVPEGTAVPIRVPSMSIHNTLPDFYWVTNMLETLISNTLWMGINSATIANEYRKVFEQYAEKTCMDNSFVPFQGHDFSMRGMGYVEAAECSGAAHLTSFLGSDTIPAVWHLEKYYNASEDFIACTVAASEHAVQCCNAIEGVTVDDSIYIKRMLEVYPEGIVSIVCDGFDFWNVVTKILPRMKEAIMARDGKVVIRPDSGDPVDTICGQEWESLGYGGYGDSPEPSEHVKKGLVECLWDTFGGTVNDKGYKVLDSHIGAIYGDAITRERQVEILKRLEAKGFSSDNIVLGIGSFTYQYNTRDTFGGAIKATYAEINGEPRPIFKDPKTGDGLKTSMKGLLRVHPDFTVDQNVTWEEEAKSILTTVFVDGKLTVDQNLSDIRARIRNV